MEFLDASFSLVVPSADGSISCSCIPPLGLNLPPATPVYNTLPPFLVPILILLCFLFVEHNRGTEELQTPRVIYLGCSLQLRQTGPWFTKSLNLRITAGSPSRHRIGPILKLTINLHLVPKLIMHGAVSLLPHTSSLCGASFSTASNYTFTLFNFCAAL